MTVTRDKTWVSRGLVLLPPLLGCRFSLWALAALCCIPAREAFPRVSV